MIVPKRKQVIINHALKSSQNSTCRANGFHALPHLAMNLFAAGQSHNQDARHNVATVGH
jgi:hypothetical protein